MTLIVSAFLAYGALSYGVQHLFILPSFAALERQEAYKNMERAVQALERETQHLSVSTTDWGVWDDTYVFMKNGNNVFRKSNLNLIAMQSLKVNLLYLIRPGGDLVWGKIFDLNTGAEEPVRAFAASLPSNHPLVSLTKPGAEVRGLLITERGPMILAARAIVTSAGEGPVQGAVVMGRFLSEDKIQDLAKQAKLNLTISSLRDGGISDLDKAVVDEIQLTKSSVIHEDGKVNHIFQVMPDLFGKPALLLRVDIPKDILAQGQSAVHFALYSIIGAGLITLLILVIGIRKMILAPTQKLTEHAVAVGEKADLATHLDLGRRDEFGVLAKEFNRMIDRLAETRKLLLDQSYESGIAQMASGVLHNIGNAVTPLKVRVANLRDAMGSAPAAELGMALAELADGGTLPDRRRDLEQFVGLAGQEIADIFNKTTEQLDGINLQVDHVVKILGDQERFSRSSRKVEEVLVEDLVRESSSVLGDEFAHELKVEVDESVRNAGAILGSRVALQQVLVNLFKNAAESIRQAKRQTGTGRIRVKADTDSSRGGDMVHLSFQDNGTGISQENMPHLFRRGFSTKSRSSGIGLHWSATTVSAMKGRIEAESAGLGQGATIHLLLPRAESDNGSQPI